MIVEKKREYTKTVVEKTVEDVLCNQCGLSLMYESNPNVHGLSVIVDGGFGSILGDGSQYEFAICERCLAVMFANFKIPPKITDGP